MAIIVPNLILGGAVAVYAFLETLTFEVEEKTFTHPDLPENFDGTRVVFLSDIHNGVFVQRNLLGKIMAKIKELQPHLILFGGDYIQSKLPHQRQLKYLDELFNQIKTLKAPLGKYGVLGNHDHDEVGVAETLAAMRQGGVKPLDNKATWIWRGFQRIRLGGVGDLWYDQQDLKPTLNGVKDHDFVMVLSHQPQYVDMLPVQAKVDLMLSGHTHGGQSIPIPNNVPFNMGRIIKKDRVKGWVQVGQTMLLITRGIGIEAPYIRFLNQPQIHLITLRKGETIAKPEDNLF